MRRWLARAALWAVLVLGAVITAFPLFWMVSASFMPTGEANAFPPRLLPSAPTLDQYRTLFSRLSVGRYFLNSLFVSLLATAIALLVNSMAGYAFAKLRFAGREGLFRALVTAMVIPGQVAMLPLFLLMRELGLVNTYLGVIVPSLASVFGIFLVRQFVQSVPDELLDAARIDGAGEFRIYWSIVLPLCRPILVTLGIFTFLGTWNEFMWPLIVLTDDSRFTLPVALASLIGEHVQDTEMMLAGSVLTVLPVLLLFLALQRHYIEGIMMGGGKE